VIAVRIVTYNVEGLRRGAQVADVVSDLAPDVLALQEPGRSLLGRVRVATLCRRTGLVPVVVGGGARTTAVLARPGTQVVAVDAVALPRGRPTARRPFPMGRGAAVVDVDGLRLVVLHLGLSAVEHAHHLRLLRPLWEEHDRVMVLGDLNERPGWASWRTLMEHLTDLGQETGPTYPSIDPQHRIDAVLGAGVVPEAVWVPDDAAVRLASDHRPIVVDL
jgi:endonuclease/exonuclease/phosphatase family metal-dependent hydrolase